MQDGKLLLNYEVIKENVDFYFYLFYFCQGGIYENHTEVGAVSFEPVELC